MELTTLKSTTKQIPVSLTGGTLKVEYFPGKYTRKLSREVAAKEKALKARIEAGEEPEDEEVSGTAEMLVALVAGWDLTDGGKPVPVSVDVLVDDLGYLYMFSILKAIFEDIAPPKTDAKNS